MDNIQFDKKNEKDTTYVHLSGIIDENANLANIFDNLKKRVVINLEGIKLINSCGVREWIQTINKMTKNEIEYEMCPPRIVEQINYISNFVGGGKVNSFLAPYFCGSCKREFTIKLDPAQLVKNKPIEAPSAECPDCGGALDFDDIEEEYFAFLE